MKEVKILIPKMVNDAIQSTANKEATKQKDLRKGMNKTNSKKTTSAAQTEVEHEFGNLVGLAELPKAPVFYINGHQ